ncbi:MAG: hypothetical protein LKI94_01245 [Sporolactobacillus sp.]|jgi:hypothetical protein|nr:hypothetical protein [Sporolactobacillus sp.]
MSVKGVADALSLSAFPFVIMTDKGRFLAPPETISLIFANLGLVRCMRSIRTVALFHRQRAKSRLKGRSDFFASIAMAEKE